MLSRASKVVSAATAVLVLALATPAAAQHAQVRNGFWIGGGLGYGAANLGCDGCDSDSESSLTGHIRLGGTLSEKVLLGAESNAWVKEVAGVDNTVGNLSAAIYFYPAPAGGLFLKGGLGLAYYSASEGNLSVSKSGLGLMAGLGYDVRVGRNISITPVGTVRYGNLGEIEELGVDGVDFTVIELGVGVTFH